MRANDVVAFIKAREAARLGKGKDPIITRYRFCNVRRNDDRVTKWIHENYMAQHTDNQYLWFMLVIARLFNYPDSLAAISDLLVPFKPALLRKRLHDRKKAGFKNFNAAYIVSTNGRAMDKVDYLAAEVLGPMWAARERISKQIEDAQSLEVVHQILIGQNGLASFMAAQVVADLKYAEPEDRWEDFYTFAASGPGSKRGLNRVMGRDKDAPWKETAFREQLSLLRDAVNSKLRWPEPITAQDMQNVMCEWDKYQRAFLGEGKPKQLYTPYEEKA